MAVVSMDTSFAMHAWAEQTGAGQDFLFLSDVQGRLSKSLGTTFQAGPFGLRPTRCTLLSALLCHALIDQALLLHAVSATGSNLTYYFH